MCPCYFCVKQLSLQRLNQAMLCRTGAVSVSRPPQVVQIQVPSGITFFS